MMRKKLESIFFIISLVFISFASNAAADDDVEATNLWTGSGYGYYGDHYYYEDASLRNKVAVKGSNIYFVAVKHYHNYFYPEVYFYRSEDNGQTFSSVRIDNSDFALCPTIMVDDNNNIYIAYVGASYPYANKNAYLYLAKSTDGGQTFSTIQIGQANYSWGWAMAPIIQLASDNSIYIIYPHTQNYLTGGVDLAISNDGGQSFSIKTINTPDQDLSGNPHSISFALGENREIYLAFIKYVYSSPSDIIFLKSLDDGDTFTKTVVDTDTYDTYHFLDMIVDKSGAIYLTWSSSSPSPYTTFFAKSTDGGASFSDAIEILNTSYQPQLAIDTYGNLYIAATVGTSGIYVTKSSDKGLTFGEPYGPFAGTNAATFKSVSTDDQGNFYIWTINRYNTYLTKVTFKNTLNPASGLEVSDAPCDDGGGLTLNWSLSPDDATLTTGSKKVTGYNVYRGDASGGSSTLIGSVTAGVNVYADAGAATGTTYFYTVKATDGAVESTATNEASAVSTRNLPLPPTELIASETGCDLGASITLSWAKSVDDGTGLNNVAGYNIYRYTMGDGTISLIASTAAGTTEYIDNSTVDTDIYYYFMKSYDNVCNAESSSSNVASGQSINNLSTLADFISQLPGISAQLLNSLTSKAENSMDSYNNGNTKAAVNKLNALLAEISAQSGKGISTDTANMLNECFNSMISIMSAK